MMFMHCSQGPAVNIELEVTMFIIKLKWKKLQPNLDTGLFTVAPKKCESLCSLATRMVLW
jgi:hypothetical protein